MITYAIISTNDDIGLRDLKTWTIQGSNDGNTWDTLDTRTNQTWSAPKATNYYSFTNSTSYTYYQIVFTANNGSGFTQVAEIIFYNTNATASVTYPIITARGENLPNEGKEKAFDLNNSSKWLDYSATSFLQIQYQNAAVYNQYTVVSGNDTPERDPDAWTIQGSKNGTNWITLDTRTGQTWASRNLARTFNFTNSTAYSYYKMDITAVGSGNIVQLSEVTYSFVTPPANSTGTGYYWRNMTSATSNSTRTASTGINDNNLSTDVVVPDDSSPNQWQGAGMTWTIAKTNITKVEYYSGTQLNNGTDNGCFTAGIQLQYSTTGTSWTNASGWSISPAYPYNTTSSDQVYTFTGPALPNTCRGVRIVGQVYTNNISWAIKIKEIRVYNSSNVLQRTTNNIESTNSVNSNVAVYPNPVTNGRFIISLDATTLNKKLTLVLSDITGKRVLTNGFISNGIYQRVEAGKLTPGIYILNLLNEKSTLTRKIVVGSNN